MKTFVAVIVSLMLTLGAVASGVWLGREPIATRVCAAVKKRVSPDECIKSVAVALTSPHLCKRVTGADFTFENPPKQECYSEIAARTNDPDLCVKVEGGFFSETQFSCQYRVAIRNKNPAACARLEGSESRMGIAQDKDSCFKAIGFAGIYADVDQPKKGPAPIVLGLSAKTLDQIAYGLLFLWVLWSAMFIARMARAKQKKAEVGVKNP
jgi:hypothetical protein